MEGLEESYLVDPASSHMLVSKIKPCIFISTWKCIKGACQGTPSVLQKHACVQRATSPNCGDVLKLQLPSTCGNTKVWPRVMTFLGMVKTLIDATMDNPQPSSTAQA